MPQVQIDLQDPKQVIRWLQGQAQSTNRLIGRINERTKAGQRPKAENPLKDKEILSMVLDLCKQNAQNELCIMMVQVAELQARMRKMGAIVDAAGQVLV